MNVQQFRQKIAVGKSVIVEGQELDVKEIVLFRFKDKSFYIKCFLSDGYVLADDANDNSFVLVREVETGISEPFPEELEYDGKNFSFLFDAEAVAEEVQGEEIFKKGDSEKFWDYQADDDSYLSLGIVDQTGERLDFYGKMTVDVEIV